ncbi:hypothetical protein C2E23DRAFT_826021 [Lenzites betulinus]|nr:hypothetical protein C2E23DRAFT_826021 [Lenzites betulinus]
MVKTTFSRILSDIPRKSQIALQVCVRPSCCFTRPCCPRLSPRRPATLQAPCCVQPAHTSPPRTSAGEGLHRRPGDLMRKSTKNRDSRLHHAYRSAASQHTSSRAPWAPACEGAPESAPKRVGNSLRGCHAQKDPGRPAQAHERLSTAPFVLRKRARAPERRPTPVGPLHTRPRSRPFAMYICSYKVEPVVSGRAAHRPPSSASSAPSTSRTQAARLLSRSTDASGDICAAVPRSASQRARGASPVCTADVVVRDASYGARGPSTCVVLRVRTGCERTTSVERCDPPGHPWMSIASRATRRVC